jgi:hypothetical protein
MKISVTKNEIFYDKLFTDFLNSYIPCPILNKFENIPIDIPTRLPFKVPFKDYHKENILSNIVTRTMSDVNNRVELIKFKHKNPKFEYSDIALDFQTLRFTQILESSLQRWKIDKDIVQLVKFPLEAICVNHFSFLDEERRSNRLMEPLLFTNDLVLNSTKTMILYSYRIQLDIGQVLKNLNDWSIENLVFGFKDYIKVEPIRCPKRWIQIKMDFVPGAVVKSKKELDLDLNWNYVNVLQNLNDLNDSTYLEREWVMDMQDFAVPEPVQEREIQISEQEIDHDTAQKQDNTALESRSCIQTQFLVDRFMVKRGRSNSNLDLNIEVKKHKIQEKQILVQRVEQIDDQVFECPKFDTEKAIKFKYIAKSQFFSKRELVNLLECKFQIELVERNLEDDDVNNREDLVVDQNTCIILHTLTDLLCPVLNNVMDSVKQTAIGQKLLSLSLRYSKIFLLLSEVDLEKPDSRVLR